MNATEISTFVDHLEQGALVSTEATLAECGMLSPPLVHVLAEGLDPPYVGYLTCRPFYRGADAHTAIGLLGVLPSLLGASHVVVVWENEDLCTALELDRPPDGFPEGVAVLEADRRSHTLRWHPMRMHIEQTRAGGITASAQWGPVQRRHGGELPEPVADLLELWRRPREWLQLDQVKVYAAMETAGYTMRWVQRAPTAGRQPSWVKLFEPLFS